MPDPLQLQPLAKGEVTAFLHSVKHQVFALEGHLLFPLHTATWGSGGPA